MSDLISKQFEEIIVEHPEITDKEHKGKPYYSIKYVEDGEKYIGYGTYKIEVLSSYIRDYFIPSAEPKTPSNGSITSMNTEKMHDRTMGDLISRQEMLRTYQELCMNIACSECSFYFGDTLTGDCLLEKWIHSLPSTESEIIYCGECIHMKPNGKCKVFADPKIRPSASDFCSAGERKDNG